MQQQFDIFCKRIKLKKSQRDDAKLKYKGVCKKIHSYFYEQEYDGCTKFLFGSYKKNTAIRPLTEDQDVDVLFKIPSDQFERFNSQANGPSNLLQLIRTILLSSRYALGEKPKAWGKVILIKTSDGKHNIELLPAFEQLDGSFLIPNTENGGSWEIFDPRTEIKKFNESKINSNGLTVQLSRMLKRWALETPSLRIKSFELENHVISFLQTYSEISHPYSRIVKDFFIYLFKVIDSYNITFVKSALNRAKKAIDYEENDELESATDEWKKIFGKSFPSRAVLYKGVLTESKIASEEFIEDLFEVSINPSYNIEMDCEVEQNGFRRALLSSLKYLARNKSLEFFIKSTNIPQPFQLKWKVRNFGGEAERAKQLRGEIMDDNGSLKRKEDTKYQGEHLVECYVIKDNICVARQEIMVPIELVF